MLLSILIGSVILAGIALVLYVDYLTESEIKSKLRTELPSTSYATIESISHNYGVEYGTTVKLKARQKNGSDKNVEFRCKSNSVHTNQRIYA